MRITIENLLKIIFPFPPESFIIDFAMRSKDILSTIAFISAFVLSAAFASLFIDNSQTNNFEHLPNSQCPHGKLSANDRTCTDILALLVQDIRNGEQRRDRYDYSLGDENGNVSATRAETVADYANASGSMEDEHLPSDFRAAWREHMKAWHVYSEFLNDVSQTKSADEKFERLEDQYIYNINKTWEKSFENRSRLRGKQSVYLLILIVFLSFGVIL